MQNVMDGQDGQDEMERDRTLKSLMDSSSDFGVVPDAVAVALDEHRGVHRK